MSSKIAYSFILLIILLLIPKSSIAGHWPGVDKTVVERFAEEQGRKAKEPIINTDQGDLLLFLFLLCGSIAGFAAGYYWKTLMDQRPFPKKDA